jgi:hypothetical protein
MAVFSLCWWLIWRDLPTGYTASFSKSYTRNEYSSEVSPDKFEISNFGRSFFNGALISGCESNPDLAAPTGMEGYLPTQSVANVQSSPACVELVQLINRASEMTNLNARIKASLVYLMQSSSWMFGVAFEAYFAGHNRL